MLDSKPRDFNYIGHKDSYPLELKGNMKRKQRPQSSSQPQTAFQEQKWVGKVLENYQDLKSIVPYQLNDNKRRQSIRTFNKDKERRVSFSGAAYLMVKPDYSKNPQRKHLTQNSFITNVDKTVQVERPQKRHFYESYAQNMYQEIQQKIPVKCMQTLNRKLGQDIYSHPDIKQNANTFTVRKGTNQSQKQSVSVSQNGSKTSSCYESRQSLGARRDDWNRSSFVLGW